MMDRLLQSLQSLQELLLQYQSNIFAVIVHCFQTTTISTIRMLRSTLLSGLFIGLAFGQQERGQWHPALDSDGTPQ